MSVNIRKKTEERFSLYCESIGSVCIQRNIEIILDHVMILIEHF